MVVEVSGQVVEVMELEEMVIMVVGNKPVVAAEVIV